MPRSGCSALYGVNPFVLNKINKINCHMKLRNVIKKNMKDITLELWNLNVKKGDSENLKENGTIERGKRIGQRGKE